jgi:hypothetical protein
MSHRSCSYALPLLLLAACSSDPEPSAGSLAGTYYGDFTIDNDDPTKSVFARAELVVDGSGDLGASTFTTKAPTDTIGEVATASGIIESRGSTQFDVILEVSFPTLGDFTATGNGVYSDVTGQLGAMLITRDGNGAVIGSSILSLQRDL